MIESDALGVSNNLKASSYPSHLTHVFSNVKLLISRVLCNSCCFVPRTSNKVTHFLATTMYSLLGDMSWVEFSPLFLAPPVLEDIHK